MIDQTKPTRATSLEKMAERMGNAFTDEDRDYGLAFQPRPDDVIISSFAKSGTTWLQQIVHGLRTGGDMDFDDISRVVPWIETAHGLGIDLEDEQRGLPRAYKSHLSWDLVPKGGKYLVSVRDPRDVVVSLYHFLEGWIFEPGSISIEDMAHERFLDRSEGRDYWSHLTSWWSQRDNPDVMLLSFEMMSQDLPGAVRSVAGFLEIEADDDLFGLVEKQSSFRFMIDYKDRFDDLLMREHFEQVANLPSGGDSAKVRSGEVGSHRAELSAEIVEELGAMWASTVSEEFGLASYQEVLDALG